MFKKSIIAFSIITFLGILVVGIWSSRILPEKSNTTNADVDYYSTLLDSIGGKEVPFTHDEVELERTLRIHKPMFIMNREFGGASKFTVFAMYWSNNSIPPKEASRHVPDICFQWNGITLEEREQIELNSVLPTVNYRVFDSNGSKLYTLYWHFIDDQAVDYSLIGRARTATFYLHNFFKFVGKYENMVYIRIVSEVPGETLMNDPDFNVVIEKIEDIWSSLSKEKAG